MKRESMFGGAKKSKVSVGNDVQVNVPGTVVSPSSDIAPSKTVSAFTTSKPKNVNNAADTSLPSGVAKIVATAPIALKPSFSKAKVIPTASTSSLGPDVARVPQPSVTAAVNAIRAPRPSPGFASASTSNPPRKADHAMSVSPDVTVADSPVVLSPHGQVRAGINGQLGGNAAVDTPVSSIPAPADLAGSLADENPVQEQKKKGSLKKIALIAGSVLGLLLIAAALLAAYLFVYLPSRPENVVAKGFGSLIGGSSSYQLGIRSAQIDSVDNELFEFIDKIDLAGDATLSLSEDGTSVNTQISSLAVDFSSQLDSYEYDFDSEDSALRVDYQIEGENSFISIGGVNSLGGAESGLSNYYSRITDPGQTDAVYDLSAASILELLAGSEEGYTRLGALKENPEDSSGLSPFLSCVTVSGVDLEGTLLNDYLSNRFLDVTGSVANDTIEGDKITGYQIRFRSQAYNSFIDAALEKAKSTREIGECLSVLGNELIADIESGAFDASTDKDFSAWVDGSGEIRRIAIGGTVLGIQGSIDTYISTGEPVLIDPIDTEVDSNQFEAAVVARTGEKIVAANPVFAQQVAALIAGRQQQTTELMNAIRGVEAGGGNAPESAESEEWQAFFDTFIGEGVIINPETGEEYSYSSELTFPQDTIVYLPGTVCSDQAPISSGIDGVFSVSSIQPDATLACSDNSN